MLTVAKPQSLPPFLISFLSPLLETVLAQNTSLKKDAVHRQLFGPRDVNGTAWFPKDVSFLKKKNNNKNITCEVLDTSSHTCMTTTCSQQQLGWLVSVLNIGQMLIQTACFSDGLGICG